ncbi:DUF3784 domain-containing protein [Lysinibacillus sp. NPDC093190]|uniref:DUF3784 domain-containing protein n=1 Tax=Lysinibacillus sp. NPDC093190 TaxID=3390575 RepID=UPI003D07FF72
MGGYITCIVLALIIIFMGYLIHAKRKLWLIAGYQEDSFICNKDKLAKLFGVFSYIVGIATFLLPFGLEFWGIISGMVWRQLINKPF